MRAGANANATRDEESKYLVQSDKHIENGCVEGPQMPLVLFSLHEFDFDGK